MKLTTLILTALFSLSLMADSSVVKLPSYAIKGDCSNAVDHAISQLEEPARVKTILAGSKIVFDDYISYSIGDCRLSRMAGKTYAIVEVYAIVDAKWRLNSGRVFEVETYYGKKDDLERLKKKMESLNRIGYTDKKAKEKFHIDEQEIDYRVYTVTSGPSLGSIALKTIVVLKK